MESLKTMMSENIANQQNYENLVSITSKFISDTIPLIETMGIYKIGEKEYRYPNCVEKSIFKMIQVMMYENGRYNTDKWKSIDPKLKEYMGSLNSSIKVDDSWNNIVCGLDKSKVKYNQPNPGYNIKSNKENVLGLLNILSGGTEYASINEWVEKVYRGNDIKVMDNVIIVKNNYKVTIYEGHTSFEVLKSKETENIKLNINITSDITSVLYMFKINQFSFSDFYFKFFSDIDFLNVFSKETIINLMNDDQILVDYNTNKLAAWFVLYRRKETNMTEEDFIKLVMTFNIISPKTHLLEEFSDINIYHDEEILPGVLPQSLTKLELSGFNQPLTEGVLPSSLTSLTLDVFNEPLEPGVLPSSLTSLTLNMFNKTLEPGVLPSSLTSLTLDRFEKPLAEGVLPSSLTSLTFKWFNQPLEPGVLPKSLTSLTLNGFKQPLAEGVLPSSLTSLTLDVFNQPLTEGVLPSSLTSLTLKWFNKPLAEGVLPSSLTSLTLKWFNKPLTQGVLPSSLTSLTLDGFIQPLTQGVLPLSLTSLTLIGFKQPLAQGVLPSSLTSLTLKWFEQPLTEGVLPSSLTSLSLDGFNQPLTEGVLPSSLTSLTLNGFKQPLTEGVLPSSLTSLTLNGFNQPLTEGVLPSSLTSLTLNGFKQPLAESKYSRK
jgi:hypothetical protein